MTDPVIEAYRAQIDAFDKELISLLKKRSEVIAKVGEYKRTTDKHRCFIRAGREAMMTRQIVTKDVGPFPRLMLAAIWRLLIAGSVSIEQPLTASVFGSEKSREFFWLAHEYVGPTSTITLQSTTVRVIGEVAEGNALVGFIPLPQNDPDHGWRALINETPGWPRIFARAPFLADSRLPNAFLIGDVTPEQTGDDHSLVVVQAQEPISKSRLASCFAKAGHPANCLSEAPLKGKAGTEYVMDAEGWITAGSKELAAVQEAFGSTEVKLSLLGTYPSQLVVEI